MSVWREEVGTFIFPTQIPSGGVLVLAETVPAVTVTSPSVPLLARFQACLKGSYSRGKHTVFQKFSAEYNLLPLWLKIMVRRKGCHQNSSHHCTITFSKVYLMPIPTCSVSSGNNISNIWKISTNWLFNSETSSLPFPPIITHGLSACADLCWLCWTSTMFLSPSKFSSCYLGTLRFSFRGPFPHFSIILGSPVCDSFS